MTDQSSTTIVLMLSRLIARSAVVAEPGIDCNADIEYEYRDAEYEYEKDGKPEPSVEREWAITLVLTS